MFLIELAQGRSASLLVILQFNLNKKLKIKNGVAPRHCIHSSYQSLPTPYLTLLVSQI
jgi:hypothetical protein